MPSESAPKPRRINGSQIRPPTPAASPAPPAPCADARPAVVPLLTPLTPRQETLHLVRNHLTYIAGTAHGLRRQLRRGALEPGTARDRLERLERAAWAIDALFDALDEPGDTTS